MSTIHSVRGLGAFAVLLVAGCSFELPDLSGEDDTVKPGDPGTTSTTSGGASDGTLRVSFEVSADADESPDDGVASVATECGDAAGIRLSISDEDGNVQTCNELWADVSVSGDYAGGASGDHYIADCLFVLSPGTWNVDELSAVDADGNALDCCESEFADSVTVNEEETTEIGGLIQCSTEGNGALDIYATVNTPPEIEDLDISPSKFGGTCVPITLTVSASDPEGDLVSYGWKVTSAPDGVDYHLDVDGNMAVFAASAIGDFEMMVTATDELEASHSLSFPLHIVDDSTGTDCDVDEVAECPPSDDDSGDDGA
jgi:hypothetical protein